MKKETADVIVLGVGSMGAAACHALTRRGARVIGLEQFTIGHDKGSAGGETRILRRAYFEHPDYIPLLDHAYGLWDDWNAQSPTPLMHKCGMVVFGPSDSAVIRGIEHSQTCGIAIEHFDGPAVASRFPMFSAPEDYVARYEPDAGFVYPQKTIRFLVEMAKQNGATIREKEAVVDFRIEHGTAEVTTRNARYQADRLVVCAGAWNKSLLADLNLPLSIERRALAWYPCGPDYSVDANAPCFAFHTGRRFFYGFPSIDGQTLKLGEHLEGTEISDPVNKEPGESEESDCPVVDAFVEAHLPGARPVPSRLDYCMYTMTPDEHFIVDRHPRHPNVTFAAGFSGHGFKFVPVMGEILADLATEGRTAHPIDFLRLRDWAG